MHQSCRGDSDDKSLPWLAAFAVVIMSNNNWRNMLMPKMAK